MGVEGIQYVMLAANLPNKILDHLEEEDEAALDAYHDNAYEISVTSHNGLSIVRDCMGSAYCMIGRILAKGLDFGMPMTDCLQVSHKEIADMSQRIEEEFGLENVEVSVWAFTHWH